MNKYSGGSASQCTPGQTIIEEPGPEKIFHNVGISPAPGKLRY